MYRLFHFRIRRRKKSSTQHEIAPDEIFLDSSNLPNFNVHQLEGRLEHPISRKSMLGAWVVFFCLFALLLSRTWVLETRKGEAYAILSERNSLKNQAIFAPRGLLYDRNGIPLVANTANASHPGYPSREYLAGAGFAHLLGFVEYPKKDNSGIYFRKTYTGKDGIEAYYNDLLAGENGLKVTEENALGAVESESMIKPARYGTNLTLSIDARLEHKLYELIAHLKETNGFTGGAAALMDITNGEMLALTSAPEFDPSILSEGSDTEAIEASLADKDEQFLDRLTTGLYTPGSIMKPFLAAGVLDKELIDPEKKILSTGSISIPNPFNPNQRSIFYDWKAHGWVDMRQALAYSSNVYFYEVGGGFEGQPGLGIANIKKYLERFGFGQNQPGDFLLGTRGTLPDPEWKAATFNGEPWRIGDTYNTSIGQYGMQVTPMQALRAVAAIANGGSLLTPTVLRAGNEGHLFRQEIGISDTHLALVREGMRDAVLFGTAKNLYLPHIAIAAKTGTAELGNQKQFVNSWVIGFFPYEAPRYAFVSLMEKGPRENTVGALFVMRQFFEWLSTAAPEYLGS